MVNSLTKPKPNPKATETSDSINSESLVYWNPEYDMIESDYSVPQTEEDCYNYDFIVDDYGVLSVEKCLKLYEKIRQEIKALTKSTSSPNLSTTVAPSSASPSPYPSTPTSILSNVPQSISTKIPPQINSSQKSITRTSEPFTIKISGTEFLLEHENELITKEPNKSSSETKRNRKEDSLTFETTTIIPTVVPVLKVSTTMTSTTATPTTTPTTEPTKTSKIVKTSTTNTILPAKTTTATTTATTTRTTTTTNTIVTSTVTTTPTTTTTTTATDATISTTTQTAATTTTLKKTTSTMLTLPISRTTLAPKTKSKPEESFWGRSWSSKDSMVTTTLIDPVVTTMTITKLITTSPSTTSTAALKEELADDYDDMPQNEGDCYNYEFIVEEYGPLSIEKCLELLEKIHSPAPSPFPPILTSTAVNQVFLTAAGPQIWTINTDLNDGMDDECSKYTFYSWDGFVLTPKECTAVKQSFDKETWE